MQPCFKDKSAVFIPNVRPEECLRNRYELWKSTLKHPDNILVIGDGNLSYSLSLTQQGVKKLTATTYLTHDELVEAYGKEKMESTFEKLGDHRHGIDATKLDTYSFPHFDRMIFNFPCIPGEATGQDA